MSAIFLICPIILSILGAIIVRLLPIRRRVRKVLNLIIVILTSLMTIALVIFSPNESLQLLNFNSSLQFRLHLDGIGKIFASLIALLWPFSYLYAIGYMEKSKERSSYYMFYVITYGVVLGISFAANLVSLYFFYELLTLVTIPLIINELTKEAKRAGRFYLYISVFGSTLALVGIIIYIHFFGSSDFTYLFDNVSNLSKYDANKPMLYLCYILMFFGFGVKAAIFPFHLWLPKAGVAPTPTTALLHAVAVVKSGVFAIIRVIYSVIGAEVLNGSVVQIITSLFASFTIIFASSWALKNLHLKRRYAYSTVSNISYIIFAATMCSKLGLLAAMLHLIVHSLAKIVIFFVVGGLMKKVGIMNCNQVSGLGKKMPISFACFIVSGLSLAGIPIMAGFFSKWQIAMAVIDNSQWFAIIGLCCIIISALLTAIYTLGIPVKAFFRAPNEEDAFFVAKAKELPKEFLIPIVSLASLTIILGIFAKPLISTLILMLGIGV